MVEAPSLPEATLYAGRLVREMKEARVPLARVAYRIDPKQFEGRALLYLSLERLQEIRERIFDYQEFMEAFAARPTLDQLVDGVATQIANAFMGGFLDLGLTEQSKGSLDLRFVRDLVGQISTRTERPAPYQSPWGALFSVGGDSAGAGYFLSDDQRLLFILAEPESEAGSFTGDRRAIEGVRSVVARLKREFPDVNVGVTGKPALANDEMTSAFADSERGTYLAFGLTLGLLLLAFLRIGKPVMLLAILTLSLCWSIGVATLVIGHLSLFSVVFISIVIGIGIDYGVYLLFRYEEELFLGRNLREALEITAARTGPGVLLSAVTAAATFYVLCLTDFRGVQELGFISGTAILLSWLVMMTVFPALVVLIDRRHADRPRGNVPRAMALEAIHVPLVEKIAGHPRKVLAVAALLTLASLLALRSVQFDYNLLNLQAEGTESVTWEKKILATSGRSGFAALSSADSLDELRRKQHAFRALKTVSEVDSALLLIPDQQPEKRKVIADFAPIVGPVRISRPIPLELDRLVAALETLQRRFEVAAREAPEGDAKRDVNRLAQDIGRLVIKLRQADPESATAALTLLQRQVYRDFVTSFQRLQSNLNPRTVGLADVPPEIKRKFISDQGRFLLQIHPAVNIWDRDGAARFVAELRTVDPEVTGTPDHHPRGHPADGARLQAGHALRHHPRLRPYLPDAAPRAGDAAGAAAAGPGDDLDARPDVRLQPQVQPRQRVRAAADPRRRRRVRPRHRDPLHGGPPARRHPRPPLHHHGRAGLRPHDHHGLRHPHARPPPRHLRHGPAAHARQRRQPHRRPDRPPRPPPPPPRQRHRPPPLLPHLLPRTGHRRTSPGARRLLATAARRADGPRDGPPKVRRCSRSTACVAGSRRRGCARVGCAAHGVRARRALAARKSEGWLRRLWRAVPGRFSRGGASEPPTFDCRNPSPPGGWGAESSPACVIQAEPSRRSQPSDFRAASARRAQLVTRPERE